MTPEPIDTAMPRAWAIPSAPRPMSFAAATATARVPQIEVACQPRSKKTEFPSDLS